MVLSAAALLREYGAAATSIDRVLAHSGAPRGSVYHHFPGGRAQLIDEAVALDAAIVDHAVHEDAVRTTAIELAHAQAGKAGPTLGTIKSRMYAPALEALRDKDTPLG
ncbi:hypothetical protein ALI22I_42400 [Saccharothrix sp. ALI-22-I]|nr:hypothetical protein ALI22I_42400 [Saccharothrix sp. ALI-22-I]